MIYLAECFWLFLTIVVVVVVIVVDVGGRGSSCECASSDAFRQSFFTAGGVRHVPRGNDLPYL